MATIRIKNGITLGYKEFGSGDKVLLTTQNFFFSGCHMELLGKPPYDYHTYLVTMRGYGESDHVFGPQPEDWVKVWGEDLLSFADTIGAEQFYYTGISHGTLAGWYTAFHQPHRLRGFAAFSGLPLFSPPGSGLPIKLPQWFEEGFVGNREALKKMSWDTHLPTRDPNRLAHREKNRKEHLEILVERQKEEFLVDVKNMSACEAATEEEYYEQVARIDAPLLIFYGMHDTSAGIDKAIKVASLVRGAKFITYEHYEHGTPDECPEHAAVECDRFFKEVEGRIL